MALIMLLLVSPASACPDLGPYYQTEQNTGWLALERELAQLFPQCLDSAEYFALYGAAQLNSGQLAGAMESLERALLLNPEHGGARVDYAQTLFLQGQLFPALQLNRELLAYNDLPPALARMLRERQREWLALTRDTGLRLDLWFGHDDNLNSGPADSLITLTISGEPVTLPLSPDSQPVVGLYGNVRLTGHHSRQAADHSHHWQTELQVRNSEHRPSDPIQLVTRYQHVRSDYGRRWHMGGALSHFRVDERAVFSALEASVRHETIRAADQRCGPFMDITAQYQYFHSRSIALDALETKLGGGLRCLSRQSGLQYSVVLGPLYSLKLDDARPGGDRSGWQAGLDWRYPYGGGVIAAQIGYTVLRDRAGYSELREDNAVRHIDRVYTLLQYRRPLSRNSQLMLDVFHRRQRSNLQLFDVRETSVALGFRLDLI